MPHYIISRFFAVCPASLWHALNLHNATATIVAQGVSPAQRHSIERSISQVFSPFDSFGLEIPKVRVSVIGRQDSISRTLFISLSVWTTITTRDDQHLQVPCWDTWSLESDALSQEPNETLTRAVLQQLWNHAIMEDANAKDLFNPTVRTCPVLGFCPKPWDDSLRTITGNSRRAKP